MNKREINKLEIEMMSLTTLIAHTPDKHAKLLYADHLMSITPTYMRLVYYSQQVNSCSVIVEESPVGTYFYEGGERE